jgi:methionyl-tRNA formyltransferase
MEEGLDTGPVGKLECKLAERVPIEADATAGDLHDRLARLGADLMVRALSAIERGSLTLTPQPPDGVTYASKIDKDETRISWARPGQEVHNHIRGLAPFPGAWFELTDKGARVRIKVLRTTVAEGAGAPGTVLDDRLTVACGGGAVRILELQRAGRQPMQAQEFLHGTSVAAGTRFG